MCYFREKGFIERIAPDNFMTFTSPLQEKMPTRTRCERVPPADAAWPLYGLQEDDLPLDPRSWGRAEVGRWVSRRGGLPERFPMNGKALCLMSKDMFASRVPHNGHMLHQDFRRRLAKALAIQEFFEKMSPK